MPYELNYGVISDVLTDKDANENFAKMIYYGVEEFHESAFAIYKDLGSYAVSSILIPDIKATDLLDEYVFIDHNSVDIASLTNIVSNGIVQKDDYYYDEEIDLSRFSTSTKMTINRIQADPEFTFLEKERLVHFTLKRELEATEPGRSVVREDVMFLFHNHAQNPLLHIPTENLIIPSEQDLETTETIRRGSPSVIEGIVASDGRDHSMILYVADTATIQRPCLYNEDIKGRDIAKQMMASLAIAGYRSTILRIDSKGRPLPGQLCIMRDWVACL